MDKVKVEVSQPYEVIIGRSLLNDAKNLLKPFTQARKVFIVTEENVASQGYLEQLEHSLIELDSQINHLILAPGESQKNMANVEVIINHLADLHFSREDVLIALGGGVIGDLVGFTASIYLRGIAYIQVPTTFLAAIDSSVGGKTAVDITQGKNLVGAFHHPVCVLCDIDTFESLPEAVFEDGCSELIKYAMIMNPKLLTEFLDREEPLNPKSIELERIVKECVTMKKKVVLEDEFDQGLRQLLNFGHTLGHALEQLSLYHISHGRGVALGMYLFTKIAYKQGYITHDLSNTLKGLLQQYHLLNVQPNYSAEQLNETMLNDKKRRRNDMTIVLPNEFGRCQLVSIDIQTFQDWFAEEWKHYEIYQKN